MSFTGFWILLVFFCFCAGVARLARVAKEAVTSETAKEVGKIAISSWLEDRLRK